MNKKITNRKKLDIIIESLGSLTSKIDHLETTLSQQTNESIMKLSQETTENFKVLNESIKKLSQETTENFRVLNEMYNRSIC